MSVNPSARSGGVKRVSFRFSSTCRGDSNEYKQYTILNTKKRHKLSQICSYEFFSKGLNNELVTAVVNKPSVFEQLKLKYIHTHTNIFIIFPHSFTHLLVYSSQSRCTTSHKNHVSIHSQML